jgi:type VI secretion system secreted protein Hcp
MMRRILPAVVVLAAALFPGAGLAWSDVYLFIPGIPGESQSPGHFGQIEVESTQIAALQRAAARSGGGGGGAGKVSMRDFHFTMKVNKASAKLMEAAAKGTHIPKATLTCRKAGGTQQEYLVVTMQDVLVSSYQTGAARGGGIAPPDAFSLVAREVTIQDVGKPSGAAALGAKVSRATAVLPPGAPPKITGASASAPPFGLAVSVTITSTGPCQNAFVDYGDGSISEGHALTGTSTTLPAHKYPTAGAKTIRVGGRDAPYWPHAPQKNPPPAGANPCTGWAPEVHVTLRSLAAEPVPAMKR